MADVMTVRQLVTLLYQCHPDSKIQVEGCDCIGDSVGIDPDDGPNGKPGTVTIARDRPILFGDGTRTVGR